MAKFYQHIIIPFLSFGVFIGTSCDAPRHNPLDPNNPDYARGTLSGSVQTVRVPRQPITDVKVTWEPGRQYTYTDTAGVFYFANPATESGILRFEKQGYQPLEEWIEWQSSGTSKDVFLNSDPVVDFFSVVSIVENNYGPRQIEILQIRADVQDQEGDIQSVHIRCSPLDIEAELDYNIQHKYFERVFSVIDLGINSMRELVGYDFDLIVTDESGETYNPVSDGIERVIQDEIEIDSPKNTEEITNPIELKWMYFNPGFQLTYDIEIYTNDDITQDLAWSATGISADSLSVTVESILEPKEYFWVIWCVDEFQNKSRSKPGSFEVIP